MDISALKNELRQLLAKREIVPMVGAGVSIATCGAPGWKTLLTNGISHLKQRGLLSKTSERELGRAIKANELTKAAQLLQNIMGAPGGEYGAWLETEFEDADRPILNTSLISSVLDLTTSLVATTNYDGLLERFDVQRRRAALHALAKT